MIPRIVAPIIWIGLGLFFCSGYVKDNHLERFTRGARDMSEMSVVLKTYAEKAGKVNELGGPISYLAEVSQSIATKVHEGWVLHVFSILLVVAGFFAVVFLAIKAPKIGWKLKGLFAAILCFIGLSMNVVASQKPRTGAAAREDARIGIAHSLAVEDYDDAISATVRASIGGIPEGVSRALRLPDYLFRIDPILGLVLLTAWMLVFVGFVKLVRPPRTKVPPMLIEPVNGLK